MTQQHADRVCTVVFMVRLCVCERTWPHGHDQSVWSLTRQSSAQNLALVALEGEIEELMYRSTDLALNGAAICMRLSSAWASGFDQICLSFFLELGSL